MKKETKQTKIKKQKEIFLGKKKTRDQKKMRDYFSKSRSMSKFSRKQK